MLDLHSKEFVGVHASSAVIRDMKFRPDSSGMVLTAATDKSARLTNLQSNTVMQTYVCVISYDTVSVYSKM